MARIAAIAGALASVALIAGCGDSGPSTSSIATVSTATTPTALSRTDYVRQADDICAESNAAINGIVPGATAGALAASTTQELQITRDELSSLESLTAPEGDSPDRFLATLGHVAEQLARKRLALDRQDEASLPTITTALDSAEASAQSAASNYGFKKCGDFGVPSGSPAGTTTTSSTTPVAPTTTPVAPTTTPTTPAPPTGGAGTPPTGTPGGGGSGGIGPGTGGVSP